MVKNGTSFSISPSWIQHSFPRHLLGLLSSWFLGLVGFWWQLQQWVKSHMTWHPHEAKAKSAWRSPVWKESLAKPKKEMDRQHPRGRRARKCWNRSSSRKVARTEHMDTWLMRYRFLRKQCALNQVVYGQVSFFWIGLPWFPIHPVVLPKIVSTCSMRSKNYTVFLVFLAVCRFLPIVEGPGFALETTWVKIQGKRAKKRQGLSKQTQMWYWLCHPKNQ